MFYRVNPYNGFLIQLCFLTIIFFTIFYAHFLAKNLSMYIVNILGEITPPYFTPLVIFKNEVFVDPILHMLADEYNCLIIVLLYQVGNCALITI